MIIKYFDIAESALINTKFDEGSIYYCTDTGNVFLDSIIEGKRIKIATDIIILTTESARTSILAPTPDKLYCVLSSGCLYIYHGGEWVKFGSRPQMHFPNSVISSGQLTISDSRILSTDKAVFIPDLSIADLASNIKTTCTDGAVTITLTSNYDIPGEVIIN